MHTRDVAFIRKLCSLGLPAKALAPSLLPAIRALIPANSAAVFWVGEDGEMSTLYAERMLPPDAMALYYKRHYATHQGGFAQQFKNRASNPDPVSTRSFGPDEQREPYFQDVMRRLDAYHVLYGILQHSGSAFAQLSLYRGRGEPPFSPANARDLKALLRYISSGLAHLAGEQGVGGAFVITQESLGVVSRDGQVENASDNWGRLLRLACVSDVSPKHADSDPVVTSRFLRDLVSEAAGSSSHAKRVQSAYGRFRFTVFPLGPENGGRERFGVLIRYEESQTVALVRGLGLSHLSTQQMEVAQRLADGKTNREIATELGLTLNTASYHVKQVYARLGVSDRTDVARILLEMAQSSAGAA